ncbi:MAG: hypothetical protein ACTS6G_01435 [Candidatus Hodgkinia cicadicola]
MPSCVTHFASTNAFRRALTPPLGDSFNFVKSTSDYKFRVSLNKNPFQLPAELLNFQSLLWTLSPSPRLTFETHVSSTSRRAINPRFNVKSASKGALRPRTFHISFPLNLSPTSFQQSSKRVQLNHFRHYS